MSTLMKRLEALETTRRAAAPVDPITVVLVGIAPGGAEAMRVVLPPLDAAGIAQRHDLGEPADPAGPTPPETR